MHQRVGDGLLRHQGEAGGVGFALYRNQLALRFLARFKTRADLQAQRGERLEIVGGSGFRGIGLEFVVNRIELDQAREFDRRFFHQRAEIGGKSGGARFKVGLASEHCEVLAGEARQPPVLVGPGAGDRIPDFP